MATSLKMIYKLGDTDKTVTWSIPDPKANLTKAAVLAASTEVIAKSAIKVDDDVASTLKDAYIYTTERTELVEG